MTRLLLALPALLLLLGAGCDPNSSECERICGRFVNECGWNAWANVEQCRIGCAEDLYRRDDAAEVIACYDKAVDPPSSSEATALVDRAIEAGFFDRRIESGVFNRDVAIQQAVTDGTCDPFAAVQCKVEAVQVQPTTPLLPGSGSSYY